MSDRYKKTKVVDGFSAIKAAQKAKEEGHAPAHKSPGEPAAPHPPPPAAPLRPTRVGHTALPSRHEIVCYECGFSFHLTGNTKGTYCPKCRTYIELIDHTIDIEWSETLKTAAKVILSEKGVLKSGEIQAVDVAIYGKVEGGTITAHRWLEVGPGADFDPAVVTCKDLRVAAGAEFTLKGKAEYRNVEVFGMLKARLTATGLVTVKPGGFLQGEVHGAHLCVEEGGGLKAKVQVEKEAGEDEVPLRKTA